MGSGCTSMALSAPVGLCSVRGSKAILDHKSPGGAEMPQATLAAEPRTAVGPAGHYRWVIVALLFVVTTINYMDRNLLGVRKPTIQGDLHFSESEFGQIVFAFSIAYAIGYAGMGAFTDKVGVRIGLAVAATVWCVASAAHGLVASVAGFTVARVVLGLGEGGNFPTCIK